MSPRPPSRPPSRPRPSAPDPRPPDDAGSGDTGRILRRGLKSALARWVITKHRDQWPASAPTPRDEATHRWDGRPLFAEDYTFVGAQAGLGVLLRLEWLPGRDCQRVWVVVLGPDGVWAPPGVQRAVPMAGTNRWQAGGLSLDCRVPLREWSVRYCGPLARQGHVARAPSLRVVNDETLARGSIDLTFVSAAPPYVPGVDDDPELLARRLGEARWNTRLIRAARRSIPAGYVQRGELVGTIAIADRLVPVRAASLRQHRWGPFDWAACDEAYQCFWSTDDGRRGWVHHTRFDPMTIDGGFMEQRGHVEPVRGLASRVEGRPRRAPVRFGLTFSDGEGPERIHAETVSELGFVVDGRSRVDLGLARVTGPSPGWGLWAGLRRTSAPGAAS